MLAEGREEIECSPKEAMPLIQMDGKDRRAHSYGHMGAVWGALKQLILF